MDAFLSGVVLAAGGSTRMGQPKQLLPLAGRPLLQHVLDAAADSCLDEIVLVLGHRAAEIGDALRLRSGRAIHVVINPDHADGQSGSLRLGLRSASPHAEAAAILLGDQPQVSPQLIDRLASTFLSSGSPIARPVYLAGGRRVPGHPVFLARRAWPAAEELTGDQGARGLIAARPDWLVEIPVEGEPPRDVDTWEDYESVRESAGRGAEGR